MKMIRYFVVLTIVCAFLPNLSGAEKLFINEVGSVKINSVHTDSNGYTIVPFILWGGDMVTFYANGGLRTKPDSIFGKLGLKIKLVPGDDTVQQARDYLSGKSPFYRLTFRQGGVASEAMNKEFKTKGVCLLQMSFSGGDHLVVDNTKIRLIKDLKGKTIVAMYNPPQIGMIQDILDTAQLTRKDINIIWVKDITGPNGPAEYWRKHRDKVDGCIVVTPDMLGLTGDLNSIGTGAEGTMKNSKVLVSTANELSRSIWDGYFCRKDWFDDNQDWAYKFVAGYLKAVEKTLELKKKYEATGSDEYMKFLKMAQTIYGNDVLPTLEVDAHGLFADARFVGYPGNVAFFEEVGNLAGFKAFNNSAMNLALDWGYVTVKSGFLPSGLDYNSKYFVGYLEKTSASTKTDRFRPEALEKEILELESGQLDSKKIDYFTVQFPPSGNEFDESVYGAEMERTIQWCSKYGNAGIAIRGHTDPTLTLSHLVKAGLKKGILKRSGTSGNYTYYFKGKPLNLKNTKKIAELIKQGHFDGVANHNPREIMKLGQELSEERANDFKQKIIQYAKKKHFKLDGSQLTAVGVGITEPLVSKPTNMAQAKQNMRAEVTIVRVSAEVLSPQDFDF